MGIIALAWFGTHLFDQLHRITTETRFDVAWSGPDLLARTLGSHITTGLRTICTGAAGVVAVVMPARVPWGIAALLATAYLLAVHLPALGGEPWLTEP